MRYLKNLYYVNPGAASLNELQVRKEVNEKQKGGSASIKQEETTFVQIIDPKIELKLEDLDSFQQQVCKKAPARSKQPQKNKNIVKNYARVMINFALSNMAYPYVQKVLEREGVDFKQFVTFVSVYKEDVTSIKTLREMLLVEEDKDTQAIAACKRTFKAISEIFIKFFCVNWIYNSKLADKSLHLSYRFKILRRIRNPEHFTYLENFNKTR